MAAIEMPASPTNGERYTATNGVTYIYTASENKWTALQGAGGVGS